MVKKNKGNWNIYRDGKIVGIRPWNWQPVEIDPKTLKDKTSKSQDSVWNRIKNYFDK